MRTRGSHFATKSPGPELRLVSPLFSPLPCAAREPAHRRILSGAAGVPGGPAGSGFARWQKRCVERETRLILPPEDHVRTRGTQFSTEAAADRAKLFSSAEVPALNSTVVDRLIPTKSGAMARPVKG